MVGNSFAIFFDLKVLDMAMRAIIILDKAFLSQLLVISIEFMLNLFPGNIIRYVLYHNAEISCSYRVVIDHSLVFDLEVIYEKEDHHPN